MLSKAAHYIYLSCPIRFLRVVTVSHNIYFMTSYELGAWESFLAKLVGTIINGN